MDTAPSPQSLIAPCGMNCALCLAYQAQLYDLQKEGFHRKYCPGCIPRGEHCVHMRSACQAIGAGQVRFCFTCDDFPCKRLRALDKRYRTKYHMSMIGNLRFLQSHGMTAFLADQARQWTCPACGEHMLCCHNGLCLHCDLAILQSNSQYRWGEQAARKG